MLHAKTLARKNLRPSVQSKPTEGHDAYGVDALRTTKGSARFGWGKLFTKLRKLGRFSKANANNIPEPASTGKIYNLMR